MIKGHGVLCLDVNCFYDLVLCCAVCICLAVNISFNTGRCAEYARRTLF